jgi:flagellar biosynthetic protein FliR
MQDWRDILSHLAPALLVIFRVSGLMIFGPIFSAAMIPVRVRVFLSFLIGLACYPLLAHQGLIGDDPQLNLWTLAAMVAMELMIGLVIGFMANLPLLALETSGLIIGQQMGLGFARLYNPAIDDEADILGQMLYFMALAGFVAVGGHEWLLLAVLRSFEHMPLGQFRPDVHLLDIASGLILASLDLALRIAAPLLALVSLETVAMGFLAKTVPQLNVLSLGFPLRILLGFGVVAVGLVVINDVSRQAVDHMFQTLFAWIASPAK